MAKAQDKTNGNGTPPQLVPQNGKLPSAKKLLKHYNAKEIAEMFTARQLAEIFNGSQLLALAMQIRETHESGNQ